MSKTEKKTRRERGLNIRVVQEQKEKKPDGVRVNTKAKKTSSRKKSTKKATTDSAKVKETKKVAKKAEVETKKTEAKKVEVKKVEVEKAETKKAEVKKTDTKEVKKPAKEHIDFDDFEWKKEEPEKKKPEEKKEVIAKKPVEKPVNYFETLMLHTDNSKPEPKIIVRDVEREKPLSFTRSGRETMITPIAQPKVQPKPITRKLPEQPAVTTQSTKAPIKPTEKLSAREVKDREIEKAVSMATKLPETPKKHARRSRISGNFGVARAVLAIACLSTAVFAIVYFVNLNSSDISLKVAAMQSGIEAVYPSYTPRGYTLADVTSSSGKIIMKFKSSENNGGYTITEEQTDWNSAGVLGNFVKPTFGDDYTAIEEQGLTLYTGDGWAAWVNGGMFYKLTVDSGSLTKKQIKTIATSL
ncbi:hypothetical protein IKF84_02035 [Candidatus Saccharibacteria bacterium]|nr:hypothetical protein [Candidatus Saccharibacteria bacterium]